MGMYGSYFFIFIRAIVCIIWYGIQTYYGANLLSVCFRCIFGNSWDNWPNMLPAGADVTSKQLLAFFLLWLVEFPFVSTYSMRPFKDMDSLTLAADLGAPNSHSLHLHRERLHHAIRLLRTLRLVHVLRNRHLQYWRCICGRRISSSQDARRLGYHERHQCHHGVSFADARKPA